MYFIKIAQEHLCVVGILWQKFRSILFNVKFLNIFRVTFKIISHPSNKFSDCRIIAILVPGFHFKFDIHKIFVVLCLLKCVLCVLYICL